MANQTNEQKQQMVKMINDALQKVNKHLENTEQLSGDLLKEFMNKFKNNITKNQNTPSCIELSMKNSLFFLCTRRPDPGISTD